MLKKMLFPFSLLVVVMIGLTACGTPTQVNVLDPQSLLQTQQAIIDQAVFATATAIAVQNEISSLQTQVAQATLNWEQNVTPTLDPQQLPSVTPEPPTATPTATATQVIPTAIILPTSTPVVLPSPTITATALPCNQAGFQADVTVPDGSVFAPGTTFTKTWRLKNTGACTWTNTYDLVFSGGEQLSAPAVVDLPGSVAPGQVIDLSVTMTAPTKEGSYRSNWKLRDSGGLLFGLGASGNPFYADIKVTAVEVKVPYDLAANYCQAEWSTGAGRLPCPSPDNDSRGFVLKVDKPTLESGYVDDEAALVTHPQMITDGVIRGKYPALRVETGTYFRAVIGCGRGQTKCDVKFQLDYQVGDGSIQTLKTWSEVYDEKFAAVEVDLSSLAGKDVRFILTVLANGSADQDRAQWLAPRIVK